MSFDWNKPQSVRTPLIGIIALILIAGFSVTNLASYYVSKTKIRQSLADNELPLTSNNIYSEIQRDLLPPVFVSSVMSTDTFVKNWLSDGEQNPARMIQYLEDIRKKYGFFTTFLVSNTTLKYYHFSGISQVISETDQRDAWYFRVRDLPENYELNVDFNEEQDDALTIFINYKVVDEDGKTLAVTGVGLDFDTVSTIVDRYKDSFGRHVYFVDEAGNIMVRSDGAPVTEDNIKSAAGISQIAEDLMATDHGIFEYERDGEVLIVSTRVIPELKWRVLVEQQESNALESIRQSTMTNLLVGLAVIIATLLVVAFAINRFHTRLEWMATTDKLTGLLNRGVFDMTLNQAVKLFKRDSQTFSVILFDVDHFKRVNDTLGHLKGDEILTKVAGVARDLTRESDLLCRWGGEEFILLARDCTIDAAFAKAESLRQAIEAAPLTKDAKLSPITISLGVTEIKQDDGPDEILARADRALYAAKEAGRNQSQRA